MTLNPIEYGRFDRNSPFLPGVSFMVLRNCADCGKLTLADLSDPHPLCEFCQITQAGKETME